jgi:sulfite exporter TauE/SafE
VEASWLVGAAAAFTTGLVGSGHCAVMCGPLACAGGASPGAVRRRSAIAWQAGRLCGYAFMGALLGAFGHLVLARLAGPGMRLVPWVMAGGLVFSALEVGRRMPPLPGIARIPRVMVRSGAKFSPAVRAALRGAATPFLPCGLLYGAFLTAAAAGSVVGGAVVLASFGAGAVPALSAVQALVPRVGRVTGSPRFAAVARRAVPLLAAGVLVWRAVSAGGGPLPPHCH